MTKHTEITLSRAYHGWQAIFSGSKIMPNGVAIPLPYNNSAPAKHVAIETALRFPGALVGLA